MTNHHSRKSFTTRQNLLGDPVFDLIPFDSIRIQTSRKTTRLKKKNTFAIINTINFPVKSINLDCRQKKKKKERKGSILEFHSLLHRRYNRA